MFTKNNYIFIQNIPDELFCKVDPLAGAEHLHGLL